MKQFYETKFFRHFLPFITLIVGGSFFIREFAQLKYKYNKVASYDLRQEAKKEGIPMKKTIPLELEYEKIKTLDIDNWENVRIPRPWEDSNSPSN
ncbi:cytochrome c oxidase assembly protein COX16 homolog l(3)neo43 [Xylocopa sonorina]|uniref:cytochrome c oxidase assembly protein COX16 homolog l(3)neo43 n=1 Tax=Xylocopa sonorina TaxID=1818115 RepID=UPI00403B1658